MRQFLSFTVAVVLLTSCRNDRDPAVAAAAYGPLTAANMFDVAAVNAFCKAHPAGEDTAHALFLQAIDAFRNKKDVATAQALFTRSILAHPTAKAYYELGNASMDAREYAKAISAFRVGEQLGFEPLSRLLYNTACAWSLEGQPDSALAYLEYAMEAGYTNADQIMKDPDLAAARSTANFGTVFQTALSGSGDPETVAWQTFKRGFTQASFPVVLNRETAHSGAGHEFISYDFEKYIPEMKGARFSRDVGQSFTYFAKVADGPDFTTLIYAVENEVLGEGAPVGFMLVSFSARGKLIDKMLAGGRLEVGQPYSVCTIQASGQFQIKTYQEEFEKDPSGNGYTDNKLLSSSLLKTTAYRIGADGHFEQDAPMIGMR